MAHGGEHFVREEAVPPQHQGVVVVHLELENERGEVEAAWRVLLLDQHGSEQPVVPGIYLPLCLRSFEG
jgi:hypothetical protein